MAAGSIQAVVLGDIKIEESKAKQTIVGAAIAAAVVGRVSELLVVRDLVRDGRGGAGEELGQVRRSRSLGRLGVGARDCQTGIPGDATGNPRVLATSSVLLS